MKTIRLLIAALLCASCAKFPSGGDIAEFTKITFSFRVRGKINTTLDEDPNIYYLYFMALRASTDRNPDPRFAPQPVVADNNPNGFVAGSPTHFVQFDSQNPNSAEPFVLYRFSKSSEVPNPSDPNNPINLASFARSIRGRIIDYQNLSENPNTLSFSVFANMLADNDADAKLLQTLQVNFLTMNRLATGAGGTRIIDALGDTQSPLGINQYVTVDLTTDGTYSNTFGSYSNLEPQQDTLPAGVQDPDLDIVDWSIRVEHH